MQIKEATQGLSKTAEQASGKFDELKKKLSSIEKKVNSLQALASSAAWAGAFKGIMGAFAELEDASLDLKSTMMEAGGAIPEVFTAVNEEAKKLGAELPGTTTDFYRLASVMKQLGIEGEVLAKGGLRAAAYLGAVLKIPYEQAGFYVAKFSQALGIAQEDLVKFMDTVQRLGHLGVKPQEMSYSFSKLSGALKILGWQGFELANELSPIVGRFIQLGYSGETVGTNLSSLFLAFLNTKKLNEFNNALAQYGITLNLVDEATGKLKGPAQIIAELDKLSEAYKRGVISQSELFELLGKLTGAGGEDLKMLATLVIEGAQGYNRMAHEMAKQADLHKRVQTVTGSLRNVWEAFTGTAKNLFATLGAELAPTLKKIAEFLNDLVDTLGGFFERHKTLASVLAWTVGGLAAVSAGFVALSLVVGSVVFPIKLLISTFSALGPLLKLLAVGVKGFATVFLATIRTIAAAMISNPILLALTLLATAVYLIIRNWKPLGEFFKSLWSGIVSTLSSVWNWIKTNWQRLLQVFLWTNPLTAPIMALNKLVRFVFGINLFEAGKKIVESLWQGIQSFANKPVEAVKNIAQKIRNFLPFSPAKEGPLRDIHKIRLIETIANAVKPEPLKSAMTKFLEPVKAAVSPLVQPVRQVLEPVRAMVSPLIQPVRQVLEPARAAGYGGNISINLGGIHISTKGETKELAASLEKEIRTVLEKISKDYMRRQF
ncbi:phage tail tape measure protein [Thermodesulfovibrio yellowstonii]|uniref:phage tail tape measure protein n=1 Tax=Thermodesulfovibrio yellowstonii TaxID=28262 RepID=UPI0024B332CF|nr:phage tail tape measure protein [Thermodesulfovibrio yellowstonii]